MMKHPQSLDWFKGERKEVYGFSETVYNAVQRGFRHISIKAHVKSGKRNIVECMSLVFGSQYVFMYTTGLNRKDVKDQQDELEAYGIQTYVISSNDARDPCLKQIAIALENKKTPVVVLDEDDYATGKKQVLAPLSEEIKSKSEIIKIYTSATPEELRSSSISHRSDYIELNFIPPETFVGPDYFLKNDLIHKPEQFFEKTTPVTLSEHAKQVIRDCITQTRNILCVRIEGISMTAVKCSKDVLVKQLHGIQTLGSRPWDIVYIDSKTPFDWSKKEHKYGYGEACRSNYMFVFYQTCTRSTDLEGWHPYIACWHDSRTANKSNYNTLAQALQRPNHYATMEGYGGSQLIPIYGDKRVFQAAATGDIDTYLSEGGKPPTRTSYNSKDYENQSDYKVTWETIDPSQIDSNAKKINEFYTMRTRRKKEAVVESYETFAQIREESEREDGAKTWMLALSADYVMKVGEVKPGGTFVSYHRINDPSTIHVERATITRVAETTKVSLKTTKLSMYS